MFFAIDVVTTTKKMERRFEICGNILMVLEAPGILAEQTGGWVPRGRTAAALEGPVVV